MEAQSKQRTAYVTEAMVRPLKTSRNGRIVVLDMHTFKSNT